MSNDVPFGSLNYRLDPSRTALVLIDVQADFCIPHGDEPSDAVTSMVFRIEQLITAAHEASVPVIFVQTTHGRESDSEAWRARTGLLRPYENELCKPDSPGAQFYGVAPSASDHVVIKHRFDAFLATTLDELLKGMGVEALVFTGIMTDVCVETSVRHATCLDYLVTVASDACASGSNERHQRGLNAMSGSFGIVSTSDEISAVWATSELPIPR